MVQISNDHALEEKLQNSKELQKLIQCSKTMTCSWRINLCELNWLISRITPPAAVSLSKIRGVDQIEKYLVQKATKNSHKYFEVFPFVQFSYERIDKDSPLM